MNIRNFERVNRPSEALRTDSRTLTNIKMRNFTNMFLVRIN